MSETDDGSQRELLHMKQELERSRDHYAQLFDDAPVGYLVLDRAGLIRAINLTAATLLGQPRDTLAGMPFLRFLRDDQHATFLDHLRLAFTQSDVPSAPSDLMLALQASARVVRLRSSRRETAAGSECFTVLLDITAEQKAERLRQAVLDALPSQIAVLDSVGEIITVNRAWRECVNEADCTTMPHLTDGLGDLICCSRVGQDRGDEVRRARQGILDVLQRRRPGLTIEYPCHTPDRQRWFLMRVVPLDGVLDGAVVAHFDITERRLAEEQTRRARDALAQVARLNAVGILASSLIHELLQPLSAAAFFCSAASQLADGPAADPERLIGVIQRIDGQVQRASDIMERLRAFLRGRQMLKVAVPLERILARACELVSWFASDHKIQLQRAVTTDLPDIIADPVQVEQVLVNLLCNAVQAIERADSVRREIVIEVLAHPLEIELIVRDTGPGLEPGRSESVFDIFESTNNSSLGLGLAISRAIAEAHGGRLWADPASAKGATFHFTLPLDRAAAASPPASSARAV